MPLSGKILQRNTEKNLSLVEIGSSEAYAKTSDIDFFDVAKKMICLAPFAEWGILSIEAKVEAKN